MTTDGALSPPERRRVRLGARPRPMRRGLVALLLLLLLGTLWVGVRGALAIHRLASGRNDFTAARTDLAGGHPREAAAALAKAGKALASASRLTNDPVWHLYSHLPLVGVDLRITHVISFAGAQCAAAAAPLAQQLDADLDTHALRRANGSIDLNRVTALRAPLAGATASIGAALNDLAAVDSSGLAPIQTARRQVDQQLTSLEATLTAASRVVQLAPDMLGATQARRYLVALQNPAEARGTGGYLSAFAEITADQGAITLDLIGTDQDLKSPDQPVIDVSPGFTSLWRPLSGDSFWGNANLTPDFPDASTVWRALWRKQTGQTLDGVIAVDPEALGYLVGVTGSISLPDGTRLDQTSLSAYIEHGEYDRYPTQTTTRVNQLRALIKDAFTAITSGAGNTAALVQALSRGTAEGRVLLNSAVAVDEQGLRDGGVAGAMAEGAGPFAATIIDNAGGNKMDYYVSSATTYASIGCASVTRPATVTVTLKNDAPASGLPLYVSGYDNNNPGKRFSLGTDRILLSVYSAVGDTLDAATVDGVPIDLSQAVDHRHPVFTGYVNVPPNSSRTLVLKLTERASGRPVAYRQPAELNRAPESIHVDSCPDVAPLAAN